MFYRDSFRGRIKVGKLFVGQEQFQLIVTSMLEKRQTVENFYFSREENYQFKQHICVKIHAFSTHIYLYFLPPRPMIRNIV